MKWIQDIASKVNGWTVEEVIREGEDLSFETLREKVHAIYRIVNFLTERPDSVEGIHHSPLAPFVSHLEVLVDRMSRMANFDPKQPEPDSQRKTLLSQFENQYGEFFPFACQVLAYASAFKKQSEAESESLEIAAVRERAEQDALQISTAVAKVEELTKAMEAAAGASGSAAFAKVFQDEAEEYRKAARTWLIASAVTAFVLLLSLGWAFYELVQSLKISGADKGLSAQILLAKILLFSFASVVFYQVIKNYNANRHLQVLNRHRANGLKTFRLFAEAAHEPSTKDAILQQATKAIFEAGDSGFVSSKDSSGSAIDLVKVTEKVTGGK